MDEHPRAGAIPENTHLDPEMENSPAPGLNYRPQKNRLASFHPMRTRIGGPNSTSLFPLISYDSSIGQRFPDRAGDEGVGLEAERSQAGMVAVRRGDRAKRNSSGDLFRSFLKRRVSTL